MHDVDFQSQCFMVRCSRSKLHHISAEHRICSSIHQGGLSRYVRLIVGEFLSRLMPGWWYHLFILNCQGSYVFQP